MVEAKMPKLDVCVVGEINLDLILYGLPKELVLDRELLASGLALTLGSSSAIFAHNLAMLGSKVGFISKTGGDPLGKMALERLTAAGVDVSRVQQTPGRTLQDLLLLYLTSSIATSLPFPAPCLRCVTQTSTSITFFPRGTCTSRRIFCTAPCARESATCSAGQRLRDCLHPWTPMTTLRISGKETCWKFSSMSTFFSQTIVKRRKSRTRTTLRKRLTCCLATPRWW